MTNILLVAHSNPRSAKIFGGTELLLRQILDNANTNSISIFFMYPERHNDRDTWVIELDDKLIDRFSLESNDSAEKTNRFSRFLAEFLMKKDIDCLHIFHQLSTPLVAIPVSKLLGIKTIYTVHDFIHVCDSFNLINSNREYCNIFSSETHDCVGCATARGVNPDALLRRRIAYKRILDDSDFITVGTNFSGKATSDFYQIDINKFKVIPPTIKSTGKTQSKTLPRSVLFLGNFTLPKGAELINELVNDIQLKGYSFIQAGRVDIEYHSIINSLTENFNFKSIGKYSLGEVPEVSASVAFFGSIWPETFCIAATEAIEMGLKIVVPDIGAFTDRFTNKENCFFYQPNVLDSAVSAILAADATPYHDGSETQKNLSYVSQIFELYASLEAAERKNYPPMDYSALRMPLAIDWIFDEPSITSAISNPSVLHRTKNYYKMNGPVETLKKLVREILSR
jgi:glycosyltransferase involved in cell wall biosynthesis